MIPWRIHMNTLKHTKPSRDGVVNLVRQQKQQMSIHEQKNLPTRNPRSWLIDEIWRRILGFIFWKRESS